MQAINDVKKQFEHTDTIESHCVTSDNIIQTNIHDIGFRYDEKGDTLFDIFLLNFNASYKFIFRERKEMALCNGIVHIS